MGIIKFISKCGSYKAIWLSLCLCLFIRFLSYKANALPVELIRHYIQSSYRV
ncbi:hypothetical protein [Campylobacter phage CJLB-14]|nr:hypothetical protein [Campylobacter phage CJLB-14]